MRRGNGKIEKTESEGWGWKNLAVSPEKHAQFFKLVKARGMTLKAATEQALDMWIACQQKAA